MTLLCDLVRISEVSQLNFLRLFIDIYIYICIYTEYIHISRIAQLRIPTIIHKQETHRDKQTRLFSKWRTRVKSQMQMVFTASDHFMHMRHETTHHENGNACPKHANPMHLRAGTKYDEGQEIFYQQPFIVDAHPPQPCILR